MGRGGKEGGRRTTAVLPRMLLEDLGDSLRDGGPMLVGLEQAQLPLHLDCVHDAALDLVCVCVCVCVCLCVLLCVFCMCMCVYV